MTRSCSAAISATSGVMSGPGSAAVRLGPLAQPGHGRGAEGRAQALERVRRVVRAAGIAAGHRGPQLVDQGRGLGQELGHQARTAPTGPRRPARAGCRRVRVEHRAIDRTPRRCSAVPAARRSPVRASARARSAATSGLVRKSSMPAARHASWVPGSASAVTAMIHGLRSPSSAWMRRVAAGPSSSGIRTSINTTSNARRRTAVTASAPLLTRSAWWPSWASWSSTSRWFTGWSSATRMRSAAPVCASPTVGAGRVGSGSAAASARKTGAGRSGVVSTAANPGWCRHPAEGGQQHDRHRRSAGGGVDRVGE